MGLLPKDFLAIEAKRAELLARVRVKYPRFASAPDDLLIELLEKDDAKSYQTLCGILMRHRL